VVTGLINPAFLITVVLRLCAANSRLVSILKFATILMLPSCWIVFYGQKLYPREGYFIWTIGMLLVLFPELVRSKIERYV
jgi:hypothetical protein